MDLTKIGKYIACKRKLCGLTQRQLAEKLGMSDKSVSKWECGICLPDVSIYTELCNILGISLNEFIAGEDIPEHNVVKKSEDNIIQVTVDGTLRRKKLRRIIAVLVCFAVLVTSVLGYIAYKSGVWQQNYVKPLQENSEEKKIAHLLSDVDGAFLYEYSVDKSYKEISLNLTVYNRGNKLSEEREIISVPFDGEVFLREGMLAIIPDFENYNVKVIVADGNGKASTYFDILENVEERQYYARSSAEITDKVDIIENADQGLLALLYGKNKLSAGTIEDMQNGKVDARNDYVYYLSFEFS